MKAMVLRKARPIEEKPLEAVEVPAPTPGPDEIRIKVQACGVCHTDLHTVEGELTLPRLPVIPGHQIVGVVDQLGANVTRFRLGDRVGVEPGEASLVAQVLQPLPTEVALSTTGV